MSRNRKTGQQAFNPVFTLTQSAKGTLNPGALSLFALSLAACGGADDASTSLPAGSDESLSSSSGPLPPAGPATIPVHVSLEVTSANDTAQFEGAEFDTFDAVFHVSASFDASGITNLKTINLGLDAQGNAMASEGRADFDGLSDNATTLNIWASQQDIELDYDYTSDVSVMIDINLVSETGNTSVGSTHTALQVLNTDTVVLNQQSEFDTYINGATNINEQTQHLIVKNEGYTGRFEAGGDARYATIEEGGALKTVLVDFSNGDAWLQSQPTVHGFGAWIDDITELQTYTIIGYDSEISTGSIGRYGEATELETVDITLTGSASLDHDNIWGGHSTVALMKISAGYNNSVVEFSGFNSENYNVRIDGTYAGKIVQQYIHTKGGGGVLLKEQAYEVGDQIFTGEGNISIVANYDGNSPTWGYVQTAPADATEHTGTRQFESGNSSDTFYGSTGDDFIYFAAGGNIGSVDLYYDAGGNDHIRVDTAASVALHDGAAGTDETVDLTQAWFGLDFTFNAGSGDDTLLFNSFVLAAISDATINFSDWQSGTVTINNFATGVFKLDLSGIGDVTTGTVTTIASGAGPTGGVIDENSIYLFADGDSGPSAIADYTSLGDVAAFLSSAAPNQSWQTDDQAVIVINNGSTSAAAGNDHNTYIYHVVENGASGGIAPDEITLVAMTSNIWGASLTAADIV